MVYSLSNFLGPSHLSWFVVALLSPFPLLFSLTWSSLVSPCSLWTVPDFPVPGYTLPFIHNNFFLYHTINNSYPFLFHLFLFFFFNSGTTKRKRVVVGLSFQGRRIPKEVGLWQSEKQHPLKFSLLVGFRNTGNESQKEQIQRIKQLFKQYSSIIIYWQDGAARGGPNER